MRMNYSGLWSLLNTKSMTKSDLIKITGLSSRVIAKLSKSQTVTTDVLLRICEALHCDLSDIACCVAENSLSIYQTFISNGKTVYSDETLKKVEFSRGETHFTVVISKKRATKSTTIDCRDNKTIYWVQFIPFCGLGNPLREETVFFKSSSELKENVIIVIKGAPGSVKGLDEGIFVSFRSKTKSPKNIYVMTESEFKLFEL